MAVELQLFQRQELCGFSRLEALVEVGRTLPDEGSSAPSDRFLIAPPEMTVVPRRWFLIHLLDAETIRIDNIHTARAVLLARPRCTIPPGGSKSVRLDQPVEVELPLDRRLVIGQAASPRGDAQTVADLPAQPVAETGDEQLGRMQQEHGIESSIAIGHRMLTPGNQSLEPLAVIELLRKALRVVAEAAGADTYVELALRTALEVVDLDRVAIVVPRLPEGEHDQGHLKDSVSSSVFVTMPLAERAAEEYPAAGSPTDEHATGEREGHMGRDAPDRSAAAAAQHHVQWLVSSEQCQAGLSGQSKPRISNTLLDRVLQLRTAQIHDTADDESGSLSGLQSAVLAPVIDRHGRIVAVLYGDRWRAGAGRPGRLNELERLLAEVLASALGAGMARQAAQRSEATLSEFFSPSVARKLAKQPEMLVGREAQVSVLFCDIRGFSAISELLGREQTVALVNDVLSELSQCVVDHNGVLVDYVGDELLAMWGAPEPQPDHAERVLAAARQMLLCLPGLRQRWQPLLQADLNLGIGINSGPARVGNVGSRLKFKYGVLGNTVNLGSRLQESCKRFGVNCVVSEATVERLDDPGQASLRRLARLQVRGFRQPASVYQFVPQVTPDWLQLRNEYQAAVLEHESGQPGESVHRLGRLLQRFPADAPSAQLLVAAARALTEPQQEVDTVWTL